MGYGGCKVRMGGKGEGGKEIGRMRESGKGDVWVKERVGGCVGGKMFVLASFAQSAIDISSVRAQCRPATAGGWPPDRGS